LGEEKGRRGEEEEYLFVFDGAIQGARTGKTLGVTDTHVQRGNSRGRGWGRIITAWRGRVTLVANAQFIPLPRERVVQCVRERERERESERDLCWFQDSPPPLGTGGGQRAGDGGVGGVAQRRKSKAGRESARAHTHTYIHIHTHTTFVNDTQRH
jgi:hypothetical protein